MLHKPPLFSTNTQPSQLGIVFDVDGVLFDSRSSNMEYYNLIRRAIHLPALTKAEEDYCHMASADEALAHIIPPELELAAQAAVKQINYKEQILPMLVPEEGLLEALHWLKHWNVQLAIFTNRSNSVEALLRYFGLECFFSPVKTAQSCKPKPHPQGLLEIVAEWGLPPRQIAFIGDSKVDELAATAAKVPFWAFKNSSLTAQLHINSYFDLIQWLTPLVEVK